MTFGLFRGVKQFLGGSWGSWVLGFGLGDAEL